jgi:hypothetical protein
MDRRKSWESSLVHVAARINVEDSDRFRPEKVSPAVVPRYRDRAERWSHG